MPVTDEQKVNDFFKLMKKGTKDDDYATFQRADEITAWSHVPFAIPTGLAQLELALGRDGYPAGRIVELYGFEMSGKTSLAMLAAAQVQRLGGVVLWVDSEHSWDPQRATELGVNVRNVMLSSARSVESIFRVIEEALDNFSNVGLDKPFLIVVDSVTGVVVEFEAERTMEGEERLGGEAKAIRRGLKRINPKIAKTNAIGMFINHGVSKIVTFGKTSQAAGGHGLKFYSSVRVECVNLGQIRAKNKDRLGQNVQITVEKLKGKLVRPTFKIGLLNDGGYDKVDSLLEGLITVGIVKKANQLTYEWGETTFQKANWPETLEQMGGYDVVYALFKQTAIEHGFILPWNPVVEKS